MCFNNCQHFCCDIEKYLFGNIKNWHSFDYYLNEFFKFFYPNIDITNLKSKYEEELKKKNEDIFKKNVINITNVEGEKNKYEIKSLIYEIFENYINYESINIERSGHISLPKKEKDIIKIYFL